MNPKQKRRLKLVAKVRTTYAIMDEIIPQAIAQADKKPTCTRGCNACCKMQVILTAAEAFAIVERHHVFIATRLDEITRQSQLVQEMCAERKHMSPDARDLEIAEVWWLKQIQCPLLLENGDCGVYETRPIVCRTHYVATDPTLCAEVPAVVIGHWVPLELRAEAYRRIDAAWFDAFASANPKAKMLIYPIGALPKMVLAAFNERKRDM